MGSALYSKVASVGVDQKQGWTASPDGRGTLDILWNCLLTSFLCCWSILVVNVPAPTSTRWQNTRQKLWLVALTVLTPEITLQVALGQLLAARKSVALFHQHGFTDWTVRHGFYANMGGFHFRPSGWKSFPINATQLHYLVVNGYIDYPRISDMHIRDKNKVDGMLRLITLSQALWFVVNVVVRAAQGLPITLLELSTVAFVWVGVATSVCWMYKPADVEHPDYLTSRVTMAQILSEGGSAAANPYHNTPLDFVGRNEWGWSRLWANGLGILRRLHLAAPPAERPIPRIDNTWIPPIDEIHHAGFIVIGIVYLSIFLIGWNFSFPTQIECVLWRVTSLIALSSGLIFIVALRCYDSWYPALNLKLLQQQKQQGKQQSQPDTENVPAEEGRHEGGHRKQQQQQQQQQQHSTKKVKGPRSCFARFTAGLRNNTSMKDPTMDNPVALVVATYCMTLIHFSCRAYLVVADFMELRSLPAGAYWTVDWSWVWPHL